MIRETNKAFFKSKSKQVEEYVEVYDAAAVMKLRGDYKNPEINPFQSNTLLNRTKYYNSQFETNFEYNFAETNRIIDTESIVSSLFRRKKSLILKSDPILKSNLDRNLKYIEKRILELEHVTGMTFYSLLESMVESLVNYNNVFLLITRNEFSSSGLRIGTKDPIAAIHVLSPLRLKPIENEIGDVIGYRFKSRKGVAQYIDIPKDLIYHLYTDKKIDVSIGTPPLEAVKDDILALRQVEELIERVIYSHASPLIHLSVGTDTQPAKRLEDGTPEIDYYAALMDEMRDNGGLATSHRVKLTQLGSESQVLRLEGYVDYWKSRVLSGLKASMLDIGESKSISTAGAEYISDVLKQDVVAYQKVIERFFTEVFFNDLLLESNFYKGKNRVEKENLVKFILSDPDLNTMIRYESHLANLTRYGLLTREEFSKETGREIPPITFTNPQISANISNTGAFSAQTTPQNQNTSAIDAEFQVLDEIIIDEEKRALKLYFYIEDNFADVFDEKTKENISEELDFLVGRYKEKGISTRTISETLVNRIKDLVLEDFENENDR